MSEVIEVLALVALNHCTSGFGSALCAHLLQYVSM